MESSIEKLKNTEKIAEKSTENAKLYESAKQNVDAAVVNARQVTEEAIFVAKAVQEKAVYL